jgi:multiple sugar transport system ATP-binding protein
VNADGIGQLTVRADGELGVTHGDTIYLSPDVSKIHKFGADGNAL